MNNGVLNFQALNNTACKQEPGYGCRAQCGSTTDNVFTVDVSGSVGQNGVMGTKLFLARLTQRLHLGYGPGQQLVGLIEATQTPRVLTLPTDDLKKWEDAINEITIHGGGALNLAPAFGYAESCFMHGRQEANGQIIAIVDGPAMHQRSVKQMAERVGQSADLIVILVGCKYDTMAIRAATEWLQAAGSCFHSPGCRLIQVDSYEALATGDLTGVIAEMCQSIV